LKNKTVHILKIRLTDIFFVCIFILLLLKLEDKKEKIPKFQWFNIIGHLHSNDLSNATISSSLDFLILTRQPPVHERIEFDYARKSVRTNSASKRLLSPEANFVFEIKTKSNQIGLYLFSGVLLTLVFNVNVVIMLYINIVFNKLIDLVKEEIIVQLAK